MDPAMFVSHILKLTDLTKRQSCYRMDELCGMTVIFRRRTSGSG